MLRQAKKGAEKVTERERRLREMVSLKDASVLGLMLVMAMTMIMTLHRIRKSQQGATAVQRLRKRMNDIIAWMKFSHWESSSCETIEAKTSVSRRLY